MRPFEDQNIKKNEYDSQNEQCLFSNFSLQFYDPDNSAGRVPNDNVKRKSLINGKIINVKLGSPDDYSK